MADKTIYTDSVTFTFTAAATNYTMFVDATPVALNAPVTVRDVGFHQVQAWRTNPTPSVLATNVRFIVRSAERASTEDGIPPHTPLPLITSSAAVYAGAQLAVLAPAEFPVGYEIPVVAWVRSADGRALRANGSLTALGQLPLAIRRGVGSGLLSATNAAGSLDYSPTLGGLQKNRSILLQVGTIWTATSGTLAGNTVWPPNSRITVTNKLTIPAGATLTVGAGTIVQLASKVDVAVDGTMQVDGTQEQPVVFMPASRALPWGGFLMEKNTSRVVATNTIFTGSGAEPSWFGTNNRPGSHRTEQALFYCTNAPTVTLTDCAAVWLAGQLGHSVNGGTFTLTRFLMQRVTSGGEFTGASFRVNDSAFIECPDDTANFVDGDNDALYFVNGTHGFTNTLFGWTKDDGVDSGGAGAGLLDFQNCWFEATFHEANSLSGAGKLANHRGGVFLNCGQGLEAGYDGPQGTLDGCLLIGCQTGGRFGDNYNWTYAGSLRVTNAIAIYNHRDVWGMNWADWTYRTNQMDVRHNWLTTPDPVWPDNLVWKPNADAARLEPFLGVPATAAVGAGFATRAMQLDATLLTKGVPVGLSTFSTNLVTVDYAWETAGATLAAGTLQFAPGEIVKLTPPLPTLPLGEPLARLRLMAGANAEITGLHTLWLARPGGATNTMLVSTGTVWRYFDKGSLPAVNWMTPAFSEVTWSNGPAELGYGEGDEATVVSYGGNANAKYTTTYFRRAIAVADPLAFATLTVRLKRDDGGIVYLNGTEVFRSNLPNGAVGCGTFASEALDDGKQFFSTNVPVSLLVAGTNLVAVEIHQNTLNSSDVSFDLALEAAPAPLLRWETFGHDLVLLWDDPAASLEESSEIGGDWTLRASVSPWLPPGDGVARFYRLKKP